MDSEMDAMHATIIQLQERLKSNESNFTKNININEQIDQWSNNYLNTKIICIIKCNIFQQKL